MARPRRIVVHDERRCVRQLRRSIDVRRRYRLPRRHLRQGMYEPGRLPRWYRVHSGERRHLRPDLQYRRRLPDRLQLRREEHVAGKLREGLHSPRNAAAHRIVRHLRGFGANRRRNAGLRDASCSIAETLSAVRTSRSTSGETPSRLKNPSRAYVESILYARGSYKPGSTPRESSAFRATRPNAPAAGSAGNLQRERCRAVCSGQTQRQKP